jgi:hypothetical protein
MICLLHLIEQIGAKNIPTTGLRQRMTLGGVQKGQENGLNGNLWQHLSDSSV